MFITVKMEKDTLLNLLSERLNFWNLDKKDYDLYMSMYERYIDNDLFSEIEFNVKVIVDNDVNNYCSIIDKEDDYFKEIKKMFKKKELDISCETCYSYIEAASDDKKRFLVRC